MTTPTPTVSAELPEALRLADLLLLSGALPGSVSERAGQELRRLHARVEALSAAQAGVPADERTETIIVVTTPSGEHRWIASPGEIEHFSQPGQGHRIETYALSAAPHPSPSPAPALAGRWSLGEIDGNWRDIDREGHGGVIRIVWKMEGDEGSNSELEAQAHAVVAALNAADTSPAPAQPVQDLQSVNDAVTIELLNERVAYLEEQLAKASAPAQPGQEGELLQLAKAYKEYIDALPADVVAALPAMPGVDGDWASEVLDRAARAAPQPATADAWVGGITKGGQHGPA